MKLVKTICAASLMGIVAAPFVTADAQTSSRHTASGFAVVDSTGTLFQKKNATGATHLNTGAYEVDFSNSVKKCVFTATTGKPGDDGSNVAGFATVAGRASADTAVYVATFDANGNAADLGFHLNVRC